MLKLGSAQETSLMFKVARRSSWPCAKARRCSRMMHADARGCLCTNACAWIGTNGSGFGRDTSRVLLRRHCSLAVRLLDAVRSRCVLNLVVCTDQTFTSRRIRAMDPLASQRSASGNPRRSRQSQAVAREQLDTSQDRSLDQPQIARDSTDTAATTCSKPIATDCKGLRGKWERRNEGG